MSFGFRKFDFFFKSFMELQYIHIFLKRTNYVYKNIRLYKGQKVKNMLRT